MKRDWGILKRRIAESNGYPTTKPMSASRSVTQPQSRMAIISQRGSLTLGLAIALGIMSLGMAGAVKWAMVQSEKAATAQAAMESWRQTAADCSKATEDAAKAGEEAHRKAQAALLKAQEGSAKAKSEVARLKGLMGQGTCSQAVAKVREGLK